MKPSERSSPLDATVCEQESQAFTDRIRPRDFYTQLIGCIPDVNLFIKDIEGRFRLCDEGFVRMLGCRTKSEILGKRDPDFFPPHLVRIYVAGDRTVMRTGRPLFNHNELVLSNDFTLEWYTTHKFPLWDDHGEIIGVAGINMRLGPAGFLPFEDDRLSRVLEHIRIHFNRKLTTSGLARVAGSGHRTFERRFHDALNCSPMTYVRRVRISAVCRALRHTGRSLGEIALDCGYSDQSHMTREFKKLVGDSPRAYRARRSRDSRQAPGITNLAGRRSV